MSQQLPPLNALRAFEAVARHRRFTKAAAELNVTRAAISHQIKYLEDYLGFPLIERKNRMIILSKKAAAALPKLRTGFDHLAQAVHLMRGEGQTESIALWVAPFFPSCLCLRYNLPTLITTQAEKHHDHCTVKCRLRDCRPVDLR